MCRSLFKSLGSWISEKLGAADFDVDFDFSLLIVAAAIWLWLLIFDFG